MKKKAALITAIILLSIPLVTAQSNQVQLDKGPGMVGAGSPVYGLEVAMDNAALGLGLADPGELAKERAAEAAQAAEKNKSKAATRAGKQLAKVTEKASGNESEQDIETAMASFQETINKMDQRVQNAPNENARQGMQTALENMRGAYQNMEEAKQGRNETGGPESPGRQGDQTDEQDPTPPSPPNDTRTREQENSSNNDTEETGSVERDAPDNNTEQAQEGRP